MAFWTLCFTTLVTLTLHIICSSIFHITMLKKPPKPLNQSWNHIIVRMIHPLQKLVVWLILMMMVMLLVLASYHSNYWFLWIVSGIVGLLSWLYVCGWETRDRQRHFLVCFHLQCSPQESERCMNISMKITMKIKVFFFFVHFVCSLFVILGHLYSLFFHFIFNSCVFSKHTFSCSELSLFVPNNVFFYLSLNTSTFPIPLVDTKRCVLFIVYCWISWYAGAWPKLKWRRRKCQPRTPGLLCSMVVCHPKKKCEWLHFQFNLHQVNGLFKSWKLLVVNPMIMSKSKTNYNECMDQSKITTYKNTREQNTNNNKRTIIWRNTHAHLPSTECQS